MLKVLMKLFVWEIVNPLTLRIRRKRVYEWDSSLRGINLGCGLDVLPGWMGIDGGVYVLLKKLPSFIARRLFPILKMSGLYTYQQYFGKLRSIDVIHHGIDYGIPFKSNTIPSIYSSHFFEHFTKQDAERVLRECIRVLSPGGMIRIAVPSLDQEVNAVREAVRQYDQMEIQPVLKYLTSSPGFIDNFSVHRHMYNFDELKTLLESVSFVDVKEWTYKKGRMGDVERLDTRKDSLFVEAAKNNI